MAFSNNEISLIRNIERLEKELGDKRKTLHEDHPSIGDNLYELGYLYSKLGNKHKAKEYYMKALVIYI